MRIAIIILSLFLLSCGEKKEKKTKMYRQKSVVTQQKLKSRPAPIAIDLENVGIGPIKSLSFPNKIDNKMVGVGSTLFSQKCAACHKTNKRFIGPAIKGIYERRNPAWVMNIMLNPIEMLEKDTLTKQLFEAYNKVVMYDQNLSQEEARALAEFFRSL